MPPGKSSWAGQPRVMGSSEFMRMFLLTFSFIGLQFCWGTEMTYATPYLLALGLSKSRLSLVWLAGPLGGLLIQPIVGMISDKSRSRYGRRRPFMMAGAISSAVCMVILGWAKEIAGMFFRDTEQQRKAAIILAVVDIYILDFVINIAQSTCRALIVDTLPASKQQLGSAWCGRMAGSGHMLVYAIGALDLNAILPSFIGDTQFKKVCLIAALAMATTQGVTCIAVHERVLVSDGTRTRGSVRKELFSLIRQIWHASTNVPARIEAICLVQFWAWIGWFPFMFYGSTWVGEIYLRHVRQATDPIEDALTLVGRLGSTAMIASSTITFLSSIFLPWIIRNPDESAPADLDQRITKGGRRPSATQPLSRPRRLLRRLLRYKPTLLNTWTAGNIMFAASMLFAPTVKSIGFATFILALCGLPSAVNGLATGTFIGIEVNKLGSSLPSYDISSTSGGDDNHHPHHHRRTSNDSSPYELHIYPAPNPDSSDDDLDPNGPSRPSSDALHLLHDASLPAAVTSTGELSGIYLGILNIYTTLPQLVGTAISWVVFSILEPGKSPELGGGSKQETKEGLSGIGVCLFIGAMGAGVAAGMTRRLVWIR